MKAADWLLHCNFLEPLRKKAVYPLDDKISTLRSSLESGLNQQLSANVTLSGHVEALRIAGVYVDTTQVVVRGIADGTAEAKIR